MSLPSRAVVPILWAALMALPACSMFGSGDDETDEPAPPVQAAETPAVVVATVSALEIGRTRNGIVLTAIGTAPGIGYAEPRLAARRNGLPDAEGFVDFDFVAEPPAAGFGLGAGDPRARLIRADRLIGADELYGVAGLRVHAAGGSRQIAF